MGIAIGGISSYGSFFIAGKLINKHFNDADSKLNMRHNTIIDKMKTILAEIEPDDIIEMYIGIINATRKTFMTDYTVLLDKLEIILSSGKEAKEIAREVETYMCALDILQDFCKREPKPVDDKISEDIAQLV